MKNLKKKGFTIVELVIVIAVIAVLAAVLIPTFVNLTKKANQSADIQATRQMNVVLSTEDLETFEDALAALDKAGYNAFDTLVPVSTGYKFYWVEEEKSVVLVNDANKIIFPNNLVDFDLGKALSENKAHNLKKGAPSAEINNAEELVEAVGKGQNVSLNENYELGTTIPVTNDVTVDLNGKDFDASDNGARPFDLYNGATLTINAEGSEIDCGAYGLVNVASNANVNVIINGGTIKANTDNGAFIKIRGGNGNVNITLNNVNYVDESDDGFLMNAIGFEGKFNLTINGGSYKAKYGFQIYGKATLNNVEIITDGYGIYVTGTNAEATVSNCKFNVGSAVETTAPAAAVAVANLAKATVTGCSIECNNTPAALYVYPSGGEIKYSNNTISGIYDEEHIPY